MSEIETVCPNYTRAFLGGDTVKAVNRDTREVTHLITTNAVDRCGDVVEPSGMDIEHFMKNPVVPVNHDYAISSIVARSESIALGKSEATALTKFRDTPLAEEAMNLTAEGLGGWSIGFAPLESHSVKQGAQQDCKVCKERFAEAAKGKEPGDYVPGQWSQHFVRIDLWEYSAVAIPANQEIVNNAVSKGLVSREHVDKFFRSTAPTPSEEAAQAPTVKETEEHPILTADMRRMRRRFDVAEARRSIAATFERF